MATSKLNIFNALPQHASDSEDEDFNKSKTKKVGQKGTDKNVKKTGASTTVPVKTEKEEHGRSKEVRKPKGVSDQPHPQERHSGTGTSAYGGKPKKGGAGKGNWGKSGEERPAEEVAEEETEQAQEEEKPEGITLQEYYSKQNLAQNKPQVNETKAKITSEQLIKELGNSTLLKSRQTQQVDDRKVGKKKEFLDVNHHAGITTEHADLLGFRTGFVEKEYKKRDPEAGDQRRGPRTEKPQRERENAKEEETPATQGTETVEGEQTAEKTEKTEGQEGQNRRRNDGPRGGRGGYKGGDNRGENRGDNRGPRKNYGGKQEATKINFEDESAFPKLG